MSQRFAGRSGWIGAIFVFVSTCCFSPSNDSKASTNLSVWAYPSLNGRLIRQPDALGNRILDYSNVGYKSGTVPLPVVPTKVTISPVAGDNGANIQAAINQVQTMPLDTNGFRGAVLLLAGEYPISNSISIKSSGVVLRGVGDTATGTILRATGTNQRTLVNITGSGSASTVAGTTHNITNAYVPVGARSFEVDSTNGLTVGDTVFVRRIATTNWIHDLGMDQLDNPWTTSGYNIDFDRVITRIEGNHIILDAPITCAIDQNYGGGTIRKYSWSGRIQNSGIEYIYGVSDFNSPTNEDHGWIFVQFNTMQNCWARHLTSQYFGYACVSLGSGTKFATVSDCKSLDPISIITGGRRYAFVLDDCQFCLVQNCYTREDRHQFVTQSLTTGPNVFVDGLSDAAHADAGPHHRWGTGALWDNITVNGNSINVQNRGNLGSGHGWAGADEVIWNSKAKSYVVQNPPTAHNWLIGSVGTIQNGTVYVGPHDPGTYDSHGSNVFPNSIYYAQLQDRLAAPKLETREYWAGVIDQFTNTAGSAEIVNVNPAWRSTVQSSAAGAPLDGFDVVTNNHWIPFTFNFAIAANERVISATLVMSMGAPSNSSNNQVLYVDGLTNHFTFSSLGWLPVSLTNSTVRCLDLTSQAGLLSDGQLNLAVAGDIGIDWAMLELQVAPALNLVTNSMIPVADAYVRGGTYSNVNFGASNVLTIKEDSQNDNDREAYLRWDLSSVQGEILQAKVRLMPVNVGTNGWEQGVSLVENNGWNETSINWSNQPAGGKRFATWIPATGVPVEFTVTPQVVDALAKDRQLSLQLFSLRNVGGAGFTDYAAREDANPANRPQLLLITSNNASPPTISSILNRTFAEDGSTGPIPFTIADAQTPSSNLVVSASSSNKILVPDMNIVLSGIGSNRTVNAFPAANQSGIAVITLTVSDGLTSSSTSFQVTVIAVNDAPVLVPVSNWTINPGAVLIFTNVATDVETPPEALIFGLLDGPQGTSLDANTGMFRWRPTIAQSGSTNIITLMVSDNGTPSMSATQTFTVTVNRISPPQLGFGWSNGAIHLSISGQAGADYILQASTNLIDWSYVSTNYSPAAPFIFSDSNSLNFQSRFYRVLLGP